MPLSYGLNVKKKSAAVVPPRKTILDDEDGLDEEDVLQTTTPPVGKGKSALHGAPPSLKQKHTDVPRQSGSSIQASQAQLKKAEEIDPSIFDYDSFHDAKASVAQAKKEAERQDAIERKPKYINNLLESAARRKQDQLIAREKLLQKEREAEGDEFADKEKFVTAAYKQQQEEARRLEAEEKNKAEEEENQRRAAGGGMQGFYKNMMAQQEQQHQVAIDAAAQAVSATDSAAPTEKAKSEAELAAEYKARGIDVAVNEEGHIVDKRELLNAGLNIGGPSKPNGNSGGSVGRGGADHLRASTQSKASHLNTFRQQNDSRQAQRERQSRLMEEQLEASQKRAREEEAEEREKMEKAARSSKSGKDVSDAKARYLARKAAKERGE